MNASSGFSSSYLTGNTANNKLQGSFGDDTLVGVGGNDTLDGGAGLDSLLGGAENDWFIVDHVAELSWLADAGGIDTLEAFVDIELGDMPSFIEHLQLSGDAILGVGNILSNNITGNESSNSLVGGLGNDTLDGGGGGDSLSGSQGNDLFWINDLEDQIIEDHENPPTGGLGDDQVFALVDFDLAATPWIHDLSLIGMDALVGSGNSGNDSLLGSEADNYLSGLNGNDTIEGYLGADSLFGGDGDDLLYGELEQAYADPLLGFSDYLEGGDGDDTLDGGSGADVLVGGEGDDIYYIDDVNDVILEEWFSGYDTIYSSVPYEMPKHVEELIFIGDAELYGIGNNTSNVITANDESTQLWGEAGNDTIIGSTKADFLDGGFNNDSITGSDGADTLMGGLGLDVLIGGDDNDLLEGGYYNDSLVGGSGDDTLEGGHGADTMSGGEGDDFYTIDSRQDVILESSENDGHDLVEASVSYTLPEWVEDITLSGFTSSSATGNSLDNVLTGNHAKNILSGLDGDDIIHGGGGVDQLFGGPGDDFLVSGSADDYLDGGAGSDTMTGGSGDDVYVVDHLNDLVIELADSGHDLIQADITLTLPAHVEDLELKQLDFVVLPEYTSAASPLNGSAFDGAELSFTDADGDGDSDLLISTATSLHLHQQSSDGFLLDSSVDLSGLIPEGFALASAYFAEVNGDGFLDLILSDSTGNVSVLLADADSPSSLAFDSAVSVSVTPAIASGFAPTWIDLDNDNLVDLLYVNSSGSIVYHRNTTTLDLSPSFAQSQTFSHGPESVDVGSRIELLDIDGDQDQDLVITSADDWLFYEQYRAPDRSLQFREFYFAPLDGIAIADGTSLPVFADVDQDQALEFFVVADDGTHSFYDLDDYQVNLIDHDPLHAWGNDLDNVLTANIGDNSIFGAAGDDELYADDGDDTLDGGTGADLMSGGSGDDIYFIDDSADVVIERRDGGQDLAYVSDDWLMSNGLERAELVEGEGDLNLTGNRFDNYLLGNTDSNILDGGGGIDTLVGLAGDDIYVVDRSGVLVLEDSGAGIDRILSGVSLALPDHVEHLELTSSFARWATGNELDNVLIGTSLANTLDGKEGADHMIGGRGDDIYYVDDAGDTTIELASAGNDLVISSMSWVLSEHVEDLTLVAPADAVGAALDLDGTGNALNNEIRGTSGSNVLSDGGAGRDLLIGGLGDDTYVVGSSFTTVREGSAAGVDVVHASISYELGSHLEHLVLMASKPQAVSGSGNSLDNQIDGNEFNNVLDGGSGVDTLAGGDGDDLYHVDHIFDRVEEDANHGLDTIRSSVDFILPANVENLILTGMRSLDATGNNGINHLIGNSGSNILDGAGGADLMEGWLGNDTYYVDHEGDVVIDSHGVDHVYASINWELPSGLDNLTLLDGAFVGVGNSAANYLVGNSDANVLDGGDGRDYLTGGDGADVFVIRSVVAGSSADRITDFSAADGDRLAIPAFMFGADQLIQVETATSFSSLISALKTESDLVYNSQNGYLYYNANADGYGFGSGGGLLAILEDKPSSFDAVIPLGPDDSDLAVLLEGPVF
ncbi:MAG: FG-GAP-like repeat-containing protein [Synechococcus sp.]|nr:FG-GAP-like repeat-containing protein [Synechococcus sp.]